MAHGTIVQLQYYLQVTYLGWPLHLRRGNSAFKNLQQENQRPKCCLYETPYVAAPIRETGWLHLVNSALRATFYRHTYKNQNFFGSQVTGFSRDPSHSSTGSYLPVLQGSHMQKKYHGRTTLRTWPWKPQERDAEWSAQNITHHIHGASEPLGTTVAWRYDIPRDWLWDACHMAGVRWGSCCKGFHRKEGPHYHFEQSTRNPTINLIHEFGNPLGIPYSSCTV